MKAIIYLIAAFCFANLANGQSNNVGIGTITPKARLHVADSSVLFSAQGDLQLLRNNTPVNGLGRRMMWYPDKSAFRAGYANGSEWDSANIGNYSVAMGTSVTASGFASMAFGRNAVAGGNSSVALGYGSKAYGDYSFALGGDAVANGIGAISIGNHTFAGSINSVAIGEETSTTGRTSFCLGYGLTSSSAFETVIGCNNEYYIGASTTAFNPSDRLFVVGNGYTPSTPHNALTIFKNGNVAINTSDPLGVYGTAQVSVLTGSSEGIHVKSTTSDLNGLLYLEKAGAASNIDQFVFFRANGADIGSIIASSASSVAYNTTSDERLKENIRNTNMGLNDVLKIKVQDYNYKNDKDLKQTGFIAQQLYDIYPMAVTKGGATVANPWMVDYSKLTPLLVKAIQEQQQQIITDRSEIQELQKRLEAIETMLKNKN